MILDLIYLNFILILITISFRYFRTNLIWEMENDDDESIVNSEDQNNDNQFRSRTVIISCWNQFIKIHTDFQRVIEAEIEQLIIIKYEHKNNHMSNFIVDASLITKKLDINKINLLLMNELNTGIDPTAINQELSFNSNTFEINKEETKNDLNNKLYGQMKDRSMKNFL